MIELSTFNPAKRLVGRLFLWFWITFLVAALCAFIVTRLLSDTVDLKTVDADDSQLLSRLSARISSDRATAFSLQPVVQRISRTTKGMALLFNPQTGEIIKPAGPSLRRPDVDDIKRLSMHHEVASLHRGIVHLIGPAATQHRGVDYQLFVLRLKNNGPAPMRTLLFIGIALAITIALSYLFARSLVTPIINIQRAAGALAKGDWRTRVADASARADELGLLSRDFNTMAVQLERMWLAQQRLLADISHELRSPLARMQMALGIAYQQDVDVTVLARIEREANRMESLIQQLLTLSRAEAGTIRHADICVRELISDVLSDARFEADNGGKVLRVGPIPAHIVSVDADLTRRAVENVVRNALHYASHEVTVNVQVTSAHWDITVEDDGPGLSAEQCQQIFAPFYRVSEARDRQSGGVGLGLSIAKAAVELHHGSISASPKAKGGLRVTLSFPCKDHVNELDIH